MSAKNGVPLRPTPSWLDLLKDERVAPKVLPLNNILKDSLFYPASGLDITPIKHFSGNVHSFVYADYDVCEDQVVGFCQRPSNLLAGKPIFHHEIEFSQVIPKNWKPKLFPAKNDPNRDTWIEMTTRCRPFAYWAVWVREKDKTVISFLFVAGEISAVYQGLYNRLKVAPKILAIIRPGSGLGGGWGDNTESNGSHFHKVVRANPAGMPQYLAWGGYDSENVCERPCWEEYQGARIGYISDRYVGLWTLEKSGGFNGG